MVNEKEHIGRIMGIFLGAYDDNGYNCKYKSKNMHQGYCYEYCMKYELNIVISPEGMMCEECREKGRFIICGDCDGFESV